MIKHNTSPYWEWVAQHSERLGHSDHQEVMEPLEGNMDNGIPYYTEEDISNRPERALEAKDALERMYQRLTPQQREVANLMLDGYTQSEVSKKLNISRARVSQIVRIFKNLLQNP